MSEYSTRRCDHCSGKKIKKNSRRLNPTYKRINKEKLYLMVKKYILGIKNKDYVFAETVAEYFKVRKHQIKVIFQKLNQEGILSHGINSPPHDCRRNYSLIGNGLDNSWGATKYEIRR